MTKQTTKRKKAADPDALFRRLMRATQPWADAHAVSRKGLRAFGLRPSRVAR